jgi:hypothetical protein
MKVNQIILKYIDKEIDAKAYDIDKCFIVEDNDFIKAKDFLCTYCLEDNSVIYEMHDRHELECSSIGDIVNRKSFLLLLAEQLCTEQGYNMQNAECIVSHYFPEYYFIKTIGHLLNNHQFRDYPNLTIARMNELMDIKQTYLISKERTSIS